MSSFSQVSMWACAIAIVSFHCITKSEAQSSRPSTSSLQGKVMVGYQGWFNCEGDGSNLGWTHWAKDRNRPLGPGNVSVDLWPDLTEFDADELFATGFRTSDGKVLKTFSSAHPKTVLRHFQWMRDYEIDGAFLQRFAVSIADPTLLRNNDRVLSYVRQATAETGRLYAVMYDLSGLKAGEVDRVLVDWSRLSAEQKLADDSNYLRHDGKPLVAVWGVGFNDHRPYTLTECLQLVQRLKTSGCAVMLGVPAFWREGKRDAVDDLLLHTIIQEADIVCPWNVGRIQTPDDASRQGKELWKADRQWCVDHRLEYLPVVFPGFSWHNLHGGKLDQIPRRKGEFLWSQFQAAKDAGCNMIYVAMFDELDEGTAIFKCTDTPPQGEGVKFLGNEGLPRDFYLELTRQAGKLLRDDSSLKAPW